MYDIWPKKIQHSPSLSGSGGQPPFTHVIWSTTHSAKAQLGELSGWLWIPKGHCCLLWAEGPCQVLCVYMKTHCTRSWALLWCTKHSIYKKWFLEWFGFTFDLFKGPLQNFLLIRVGNYAAYTFLDVESENKSAVWRHRPDRFSSWTDKIFVTPRTNWHFTFLNLKLLDLNWIKYS